MKINNIFLATQLGVGLATPVQVPERPGVSLLMCSEGICIEQAGPNLMQNIKRDLQNDNGATAEVRSIGIQFTWWI